MPMVKVWNDNDYEHRETFKEREIIIPARGHIEMEYYEAHEFKGKFVAIKRDADNQPIPQTFKKIRVDDPVKDEVDPKLESNRCAACNYRGMSPKDLFDHITENHSHQAVVDEDAERAIKAKKKVS